MENISDLLPQDNHMALCNKQKYAIIHPLQQGNVKQADYVTTADSEDFFKKQI